MSCRVLSLPPELVGLVVQELAEQTKSRAALRCASLIARVWRVPSQSALFSRFSFCAESSDAMQIPRLLFMSMKPSLAHSVTSLTISPRLIPLEDIVRWVPLVFTRVRTLHLGMHPRHERSMDHIPDEIYSLLCLPKLFPRLQKLRYYEPYSPPGKQMLQPLPLGILDLPHLTCLELRSNPDVPLDILQAISGTRVAKSIQEIRLQTNGFTNIHGVFASFVNLRRLELSFVWVPRFSEPIDSQGVHGTYIALLSYSLDLALITELQVLLLEPSRIWTT
jgi:hypothetical protein